MQKKKLFGRIGLALVALMTIIAYHLPTPAMAVSDAHTDVIRVTVYDQYPAVKFTAPLGGEDGYAQSSPFFQFKFDYENSSYVDVTLVYDATNADTGEVETKEVPLKRYEPTDLDPTFNYASGSQEYDINLATCKIGIDEDVFDIPGCVSTRTGGLRLLGFTPPTDNDKLVYNRYQLHIESYSPVGYDEDWIEFYYVPAYLVQTGADADNNDPEVDVIYDKDVVRLGLEIYDKQGNKISDAPIYIDNTSADPDATDPTSPSYDPSAERYPAGTHSLTLPFGSYGLASGEYIVKITTYDENGEVIESPWDEYIVTYEAPAAPDIPNTGRFLGNLNIAKTDYVITALIAFSGVIFIAFLVLGRKKKNYRKNYRSRR
ncbi:hypothetical protein IJI17_00970 [Candidatus Saccharibacteria bacterium]|nr:hypothetical protein [Candidatus Saccharibacteria bacterium]